MLLALCMGFASISSSQDFSKEWRFIRQGKSVKASTDNWQTVSIPHTWNAVDAQDGGGKDKMSRDGYYRGPASYAKDFVVPQSYAGKRVFIRFEAVSSVSRIYLNDTKLGEHKGAFGAFTFEITDLLKHGETNNLRVLANNAWNKDIPPLSGDFPIFGGIYRSVELFAKEPVCISPLRRGSHGVYLRQENISEKEATLNVTTLISNAKPAPVNIAVTVEMMDKDGKVVAIVSDKLNVHAKEERECKTALKLSNPHLWDGRRDPYLYTLKVTISDDDKTLDSYTCAQGFRYFKVDGKNGFFLNGKPYQLWGINRHQDHKDMGWAITKKQHDIDLALIDEMGTRAIRLAHYPHAEYFYQRCDELGIMVTAELPLVDCISNTKEFTKNTTLQMNEMIDIYGNYTCVFAYGLYNEMYHKKSPPAEELLNAMHDLCKKRDPSRLTYGGTNKGSSRLKLNNATELLAFNGYPGWYGRSSAGLKGAIDGYLKKNSNRGIAISEYGAGASIKHHETIPRKPSPGGKWHPEEYQSVHHEIQFTIMKNSPQVWGSFIWNMFDFCSVWRNEGDRPGINDKGIVTHDRKTRKDAFFFYKANWNDKPMLYITSRRHIQRAEKTTPVKVYANVEQITLTVNGKNIGTKDPSDMCIITWEEVELKEGENTLLVTSGNHSNSCQWTYSPKIGMTAEETK